MMIKRLGVALLLMFCTLTGIEAQITATKINEVLVINESNFVDGYGKHHPWIELYNNSAQTIDLRGCYLTDDKNNPKKYMIPKGDVLTKIPPRQHVLFWADNNPSRGTFHLNFTLNSSKENYIALYNTDGVTLIDEAIIPANQKTDISYGLQVDGVANVWKEFIKVTPSTNNVTLDSNEKIENLQQNDAVGIGMTITAMGVVFFGLIMLYLLFKLVGNLAIKIGQRNAEKAAKAAGKVTADSTQEPVSGAVYAAIATALYEFNDDSHDIENTVLTIRKVERRYSPWSSKLYGLRQLPTKK